MIMFSSYIVFSVNLIKVPTESTSKFYRTEKNSVLAAKMFEHVLVYGLQLAYQSRYSSQRNSFQKSEIGSVNRTSYKMLKKR